MGNYPRGSEWRKWDLHIHTPASFAWNGGKTLVDMSTDEKELSIKQFIQAVNDSDSVAFAITDYWTFDWFTETREYLNNHDGELKKTIFPGMELRIECPVNYRLNIQVILSDKITNQQLIDFKSKLQIRVGNQNKNLSSDAVVELAKTLSADKAKVHGFNNPDTLSRDELQKLGCMTAEITKDSLREAFSQIPRDAGYIVLPYDTSDGLLKLDWSKHPQDDNYFMQSAHIFETRDKRNIDLFNGIKTEENKIFFDNFYKTIGSSPKPCISGSDAHTYSDYGKFPSGRSTWVKAEPTFEGLKQMLYEPTERVKIQTNNPHEDRTKIHFESISITGSTHYILPNLKIPLNRELVTLIGGRGSGKSALLDTFAFFNEEHSKTDRNKKKKIVEFFRSNEEKLVPSPSFTLTSILVDKDNKVSEFKKTLSEHASLELPFLYLGQESLSSISTNDIDLTRTVCDLVGIDINEAEQQELISSARAILSEIDNTKKQIDDVTTHYIPLGYSYEIEIDTWVKKYLQKLIDQQKRLSSKETRETLDSINKKTEQGIKLKELKETSEDLSDQLKNNPINAEIQRFNVGLAKIYPDHTQLIPIDSRKLTNDLKVIIEKATGDMESLRKEIIEYKQTLLKQGIKEDVNSLLQASENLQRHITNTQKDLVIYDQCIKKLKLLHTDRGDNLQQILKSRNTTKDIITNAFVSFKDSREDSSDEEKELFAKMIEGISIEGVVDFDSKIFTSYVLNNFVDQRTIQNETALKNAIVGTNDDGSPKDINFPELINWIQGDLSNQKYFCKDGFKGITQYIFTQWPEFLKVRASAKLNDKPTDQLSIGQRGTLLLKVLLATSSAKQVFIIDQPEDNLDNDFIMNQLVPLIRKAKKSRQIIISTHNANLVVNTDAEQVIVARLDQEKEYLSGGLENPEIISSVCQILEGGREAFQKREQKYNFPSD